MTDQYTRNPALGAPPVQIAFEADWDQPHRVLMQEYENSAAPLQYQSAQGASALISLPYVSVVQMTNWGGGPIIWRVAGTYANTVAALTWTWALLRDDGASILSAPIAMAAVPFDAAANGSFQGVFELHQIPYSGHSSWEQWLYYKFLVRANATTADTVYEGRVKCAQAFTADVRLQWTMQKSSVNGTVTFRNMSCIHENPRSGS